MKNRLALRVLRALFFMALSLVAATPAYAATQPLDAPKKPRFDVRPRSVKRNRRRERREDERQRRLARRGLEHRRQQRLRCGERLRCREGHFS